LRSKAYLIITFGVHATLVGAIARHDISSAVPDR
jgi:hypothetical protein